MQHLLNAMKAQAAAMDAARGQPRWGIVTNVDAANHVARVTIQPEGVQSGWLPHRAEEGIQCSRPASLRG